MKNRNAGILIIQILLFIVLVLYLLGRARGLSILLFWPIILAIVFVSLLIAYKLPDKYKIVSLIILSFSMSVIPVLILPEIYQIGRDDVFEAQFASIVIENGKWDPTLGSGFAKGYYGYNPALHFVLAFASITTGIDAYILTKYVFFVFFRVLLAMLVFLLMSSFFGKKSGNMPYLALLIFIGSAGMAFLSVTRRTVASLFLILAIFAILKAQNSGNRLIWNLLYMLFSFMIVVANHSIAYYFMIFLAGAAIFSALIRLLPAKYGEREFPPIFLKLAYFAAVFSAWEILVTKLYLISDMGYVAKISEIVLSGFGVESFLGEQTRFGINIYHSYELFIIYSAQLLFLLIGSIGLVFFIWHLLKKKELPEGTLEHRYFMVYLGLFGTAMYAFSSILMRTSFDVAVIIILWFFSMPVCIFIAYFFEAVIKKAIPQKIYFWCLALALLYFFTGSLLMGVYTPRITNRALSDDVTIGSDQRSKTMEIYSSASWLAKNSGKGKNIIGDINIFEIFGGFFQFEVNPHDSYLKKLYFGSEGSILGLISKKDIWFGSYKHNLYYGKADYFVINRAFSRFYSEGFLYPVSEDNLKRLDSIALLDKVYSNNEIQIYKTGGNESNEAGQR